jgi:hypothetical protein
MTTKAKGTSIRQKITDLATKLDVPFQNIQTAFMIERLVARLVADKNLAKHLEFNEAFNAVVKALAKLEKSFK